MESSKYQYRVVTAIGNTYAIQMASLDADDWKTLPAKFPVIEHAV